MSGEWESIVGIGCIIAVMFLGFTVYSIYQKRRQKRRMLEKIRAAWGTWPEREYEYEELQIIAGYFENRKSSTPQIDAITWNDLDMDRIFMLLNHTWSFMGEGYLYDLLHTPSFSDQELEELELLIQYFQEHVSQREEMQMFFAAAGKSKKHRIFDYIYNLAEASTQSIRHHLCMGGLFLLSIALLFVIPQAAILLVILTMYLSMMDYYKKKRPIEPYVMSCGFLLKTLQTAQELEKMNIPELKPYQKQLQEAREMFGRLKRNTFFLMAGSRTDADLLVAVIMYINSCLHIDLIQFSTIVREMKAHLSEYETLIDTMGRIEAAIAIASFRTMMDGNYTIPQLGEGIPNVEQKAAPQEAGAVQKMQKAEQETQKMPSREPLAEQQRPYLHALEVFHPLIQNPVKNSICADHSILLTGSNASGKSTFLKTVAINALLAQTIHTCMASSWEGSYFRIFSSMALQDNLVEQESYYIVEIKSLKRILDQIEVQPAKTQVTEAPVLCFVDEVLRGTNTVERIAASSQILKYMAGRQVLCFAATHDVELTHILEADFDNYHFQEEIEENDIKFDYILYPGRAVSRNAIKLLQLMGYEESVVRRAEEEAASFLANGEWSAL